MPIVQIKVNNAKEVWKSPDGQRKIFELDVETDGHTGKMKTYSDHISTGFEGEVEVYEKEGRNGTEQFVRGVKKDGYTPQASQGSSKAPERSDFTMYLSYAKDLAVALIAGGESLDKLPDAIEQVALAGHQLYSKRPGAVEEEGIDVNNLFK